MFFRAIRFNMAWDATRAANQENNRYPVGLLKLVVALLGFRMGKDVWGFWQFDDKDAR